MACWARGRWSQPRHSAAALGVSRQMLHGILNGSAAVTPEMALRFGKFCGNRPHLRLRMQQVNRG